MKNEKRYFKKPTLGNYVKAELPILFILPDTLDDIKVDLEDFDAAQEELEKSCRKKQNKHDQFSFGSGIGGFFLGIISAVGSAFKFIIAFGFHGDVNTWDVRENILGDLGDAVKHRMMEEK